jgi:hypothetical protein
MKSYNAPVPPNDGELHDASGLEFPDWSGMAPHHTKITFEEAVRWNDEMLASFRSRSDQTARRNKVMCDVPFSL